MNSVTIQDVAAAAGVSRAAVSKVIRDAYGVSPAMRERVNRAIADLGYRPRAAARAMRGSSYTIGVEIPSILNQFFPKIIRGAQAALADTPYQLIITPAGPDHDWGPSAIQVLADRQVDGIVAISPAVSPTWLDALADSVPLVMVGCHRRSAHHDTIVGDDLVGADLAVRHLYELGHRRIVHLTMAAGLLGSLPDTPHRVRLAGYRRTMAQLGLVPEVVETTHDPDGTRGATRALLSASSGPIGLFVAHDEMALGALEAVHELGLGPGEAAVIGYDDTDIAGHPRMALTSVNQSGTRMGARAVELLLERIAGRTEPVFETLTPVLCERGSSGRTHCSSTLDQVTAP